MRFGGHETFPVREGWLSKGLALLEAEPAAMDRPLVADDLGVGRNMAKSIKHWLVATGLAARPGRTAPLELTDLGRTICARDPYMLRPGSWWALHANLVARETDAVAWSWFFNVFARERFDRLHCAEQLAHHAAMQGPRSPSRQTLQRDVLCLLASYARPVPPEHEDPEDGRDSPFRALGLLTHFRESDSYQVNRGRKAVPPELLAYALARAFGSTTVGEALDTPFPKALAARGSPGRALALTSEVLAELLDDAASTLPDSTLSTTLLGGERTIHLARREPLYWLHTYYDRMAHV